MQKKKQCIEIRREKLILLRNARPVLVNYVTITRDIEIFFIESVTSL